MAPRFPIIAVLLFSLACAASRSLADDDDTFYRGKTVRIVVGAPPGGGFDIYSRALARYKNKFKNQ